MENIKNKKGVRRFFERSLNNLDLEYIDAYIINAPGPFHDLDGNYELQIPEGYDKLIFSYTGYTTSEYDISNSTK